MHLWAAFCASAVLDGSPVVNTSASVQSQISVLQKFEVYILDMHISSHHCWVSSLEPREQTAALSIRVKNL